MALTLLSHPFASYCQKVLIALYENGIPFTHEVIEGDAGFARLATLWPPRQFPVLLDGSRTIAESTTIIEYLDVHHPGATRWLPDDRAAAIDVRFMDRVFDHHVQTPMQAIVGDALRPPERRDPTGVADARAQLDTIYAWLEQRLSGRPWACGGTFTLADCAGGPALFYADWVRRIEPARHPTLHAYRERLKARPAFARVIDEARRYRPYFPLGAPDRD